MKMILECSNQYTNIIKRKLNAAFNDINYMNTYTNDVDIYLKEVISLDDILQIEKRKAESSVDIVCLINSGEYMFELLDFQPIAFLRTTSLHQDLDELIHRMQYTKQGLGVMLDFQCGYQKIRMCVDNIIYIESYAHYLLIHTTNSSIKVREKMSNAFHTLQPFGFIQVHRSYLINEKYVSKISSDQIIMNNTQMIPIGKKYKQVIQKQMDKS